MSPVRRSVCCRRRVRKDAVGKIAAEPCVECLAGSPQQRGLTVGPHIGRPFTVTAACK
jgi:hypothetical protein